MSPRASYLVEQCMFWLERAEAGSMHAGRPEFWRRECLRVTSELIGAGSARSTSPNGVQAPPGSGVAAALRQGGPTGGGTPVGPNTQLGRSLP